MTESRDRAALRKILDYAHMESCKAVIETVNYRLAQPDHAQELAWHLTQVLEHHEWLNAERRKEGAMTDASDQLHVAARAALSAYEGNKS